MNDLNQNELEALRVLWERGKCKPADIQKHFGWTIENATLRSVLRVLVEEGHATRTKVGKAFYYQAKVSRKGLMVRMARRLSEVFAGGSTAALVAQLMDLEKLSPEDIRELQQTAGQDTNGTASHGRGGRKS